MEPSLCVGYYVLSLKLCDSDLSSGCQCCWSCVPVSRVRFRQGRGWTRGHGEEDHAQGSLVFWPDEGVPPVSLDCGWTRRERESGWKRAMRRDLTLPVQIFQGHCPNWLDLRPKPCVTMCCPCFLWTNTNMARRSLFIFGVSLASSHSIERVAPIFGLVMLVVFLDSIELTLYINNLPIAFNTLMFW